MVDISGTIGGGGSTIGILVWLMVGTKTMVVLSKYHFVKAGGLGLEKILLHNFGPSATGEGHDLGPWNHFCPLVPHQGYPP